MTWFDLIGGPSFKLWLVTTTQPHQLKQGSRLDPFGSSMRKLHLAQPRLDYLSTGGTSASGALPKDVAQMVSDMKGAFLLSPNGDLADFGKEVLSG